MAAFDPATLDRWRALAIVDRNGTTVGTISEFYLDRETGYPTWAVVDTGLFGSNQTFVPLVHATEIDDGLQVPYEKRHIKDAPRVDLHDELTPDEEATLFGHYGVEYQPSAVADSPTGDVEGSGSDAVPDEPGSVEGPGPVPVEPGSVEGPGPVPAEPGTVEHHGAGPVAGTVEADEVPQVTPGGFGLAEAQREDPNDPDLSRTAPDYEQSRPAWGDHDPDPDGRPAEERPQAPDGPDWPPAGSFEEPTPAERPVTASDRWREAKLAAERERIDRTAAAQPEERSPLERARRRLERLVGGGQDDDSEGISPAERDAAEQARRARLGLDEDDRRR